MSPEKQRRTFLSYSRINKDFALQLAKELKSAGFLVWLDQLDIPTGARWDDELEKALEACEIFMVILTPASISSENVKDEIGYAIDHGKRILPILLKDAKVPLRLRRFQYVDFTTKSFDEGIESAKQLLRNLINEPTIPRPDKVPGVQEKQAQAKTRQTNQEADRAIKQKPASSHRQETKSVSTTLPLKIPLLMPALVGIGAIVIVILALIFVSTLSGGDDPPTVVDENQQLAGQFTATQEAPTEKVKPSSTPEPTTEPPTSIPLPSATPTFAPPVTPYVRILEITIDAQQNYVVEYETYGYTETLPGTHIHFFFDTVAPEQAGSPGSGPWILYGGPRPFTEYTVSNRPASAMQMCALVANSNHSIQLNSGNCMDLP